MQLENQFLSDCTNFSLSKGEVEILSERLLELFIFSICGGVIEVLLKNAGVLQNVIENYADTGCFCGSVECIEKKFILNSKFLNWFISF